MCSLALAPASGSPGLADVAVSGLLKRAVAVIDDSGSGEELRQEPGQAPVSVAVKRQRHRAHTSIEVAMDRIRAANDTLPPHSQLSLSPTLFSADPDGNVRYRCVCGFGADLGGLLIRESRTVKIHVQSSGHRATIGVGPAMLMLGQSRFSRDLARCLPFSMPCQILNNGIIQLCCLLFSADLNPSPAPVSTVAMYAMLSGPTTLAAGVPLLPHSVPLPGHESVLLHSHSTTAPDPPSPSGDSHTQAVLISSVPLLPDVPVTPASAPPTPLARFQLELSELPNVRLPRHEKIGGCALVARTMEKVSCLCCDLSIGGGGGARGSLLTRAKAHCESEAHRKLFASMRSTSQLDFAAVPPTAEFQLDRTQRQLHNLLESARIRCVGFFREEFDYPGEFVGHPPSLLHDRIGADTQPYRKFGWEAFPNGDALDSRPCFRALPCAANSYHLPTMSEKFLGAQTTVCPGCKAIPLLPKFKQLLRDEHQRVIRGGQPRGSRGAAESGGLERMQTPELTLLARTQHNEVRTLRKRVGRLAPGVTVEARKAWLLNLSSKATVQVCLLILLLNCWYHCTTMMTL